MTEVRKGLEVHVLMVSLALQGHINPMLKLAKCLNSKGIEVTIATTDVARHLMLESNNLRTTSTTKIVEPGITIEFFGDGLAPEFDRSKNVEVYIRSLKTEGAENLSKLMTKMSDEGNVFSCVIINPFMMGYVPSIAEKHSIPCAVLWIQACATYSIYYNYFNHQNLFPPLNNTTSDECVVLPSLPALKVSDLPTFILPSTPSAYYEITRDFITNLDKVKWLLVNSFDQLESDTVKYMSAFHPVLPIGPLVSPFLLGKERSRDASVDLWIAENSCIDWLDKQKPSSVIYISFGSITVLTQQGIDNLAMALTNVNKPFLWVNKPPEKGAEGPKAGKLSKEFLDATKAGGLVVKWCPQDKVLMHKSVACFITHCGWNSTLETVTAGVPVIAYPEWTDQPIDAKLLVDMFKIGERVKLENSTAGSDDRVASREELERCIVEVLDGPRAVEMKRRALKLKKAALNAVAIGGSSDKNLDHFINRIVG